MNKLKTVMMLLVVNEVHLPAEWLDHSFTGSWQSYRECRVGGDILLIYKLVENTSFQ